MYIYKNSDWPYFQIDENLIRSKEEKLAENRGYLRGTLNVINDKEEVSRAIIDSLRSSWAIEGIELSEPDLYSSIAKRLGIPFKIDKTKTYYDGITEVLFDAVENHTPLTLDRILLWHKQIVEANPGVKRGIFRDDNVYVVSGSMKNTNIVYEAPPASDVSTMMKDFIEFVNSTSYSDTVMSAIAHYYFVAIHPFEDGNGRTARMISDWLLYRNGSDVPLVFISTEIKKKRKEYYAILDRTSRGISMNVTEWVSWFLDCLSDAYTNAIDKIQMSLKVRSFFERMKSFDLNERQKKFLERVLRADWQGTLTAKKYAVITSCHVDTANRDLKKLVSYGAIMKEEGGSKNTHYSVLL